MITKSSRVLNVKRLKNREFRKTSSFIDEASPLRSTLLRFCLLILHTTSIYTGFEAFAYIIPYIIKYWGTLNNTPL